MHICNLMYQAATFHLHGQDHSLTMQRFSETVEGACSNHAGYRHEHCAPSCMVCKCIWTFRICDTQYQFSCCITSTTMKENA